MFLKKQLQANNQSDKITKTFEINAAWIKRLIFLIIGYQLLSGAAAYMCAKRKNRSVRWAKMSFFCSLTYPILFFLPSIASLNEEKPPSLFERLWLKIVVVSWVFGGGCFLMVRKAFGKVTKHKAIKS